MESRESIADRSLLNYIQRIDRWNVVSNFFFCLSTDPARSSNFRNFSGVIYVKSIIKARAWENVVNKRSKVKKG